MASATNDMDPGRDLLQAIEAGEARVGILGMGYVGLGLALALAESGLEVVGYDTSEPRTRSVADPDLDLQDAPADRRRPLLEAGRLRPTTRLEDLDGCRVLMICVPTPLRKTREPDISFILGALQSLKGRVLPGSLVILESTTFPGTTEEVLRPALEEEGLEVGRTVFLAFSPERVDPGNRTFGLRNTPKVVGGATPACTRVAEALYRRVSQEVVAVSNPATAEMAKILENTFRAVNIALANEVALICERLGLDVWEVVRAASSKPYGFMPFWPGPGLGGHCIPVDPLYLTWKVRLVDYVPRLIELADRVNREMPEHVVHLVSQALDAQGVDMNRARVAVLGVAYKKDVSDTRESPALRILEALDAGGAEIRCHDPHVQQFALEDGSIRTCVGYEEALDRSDCTLILTNHTAFDSEDILARSRALVDTRNLTEGLEDPRIWRLGDGLRRSG